MNREQRLMLLYCEENVHAGAGSSTGTIDLPIQRESHTGYPKIESSSLRGAIRESIKDSISNNEKSKFESVFGNWDNGDQQSAIDFPDAKLLLFPVRSFKGVFAWITCPMVLNRFKKDCLNWFGIDLGYTISDFENNEIITISDSLLELPNDENKEVLLEEFLFKKTNKQSIPKINEQEFGTWLSNQYNIGGTIAPGLISHINSKLAIISDDVFRDFVQLYTVKITRNRINPESGTADGNGLFNEEFLPSESILYSFALTTNEFKKDGISAAEAMTFFVGKFSKLFRLGGDKGIGKGLIRQSLVNGI